MQNPMFSGYELAKIVDSLNKKKNDAQMKKLASNKQYE